MENEIKSSICNSALHETENPYHFADHHDVGPQVLVDSEDVQNADVPEDDVDAVDDAAVAHVRLALQPH